MSFVSAGPLRRRIRPGDELRYRLAGCTPGSLIQGIKIFSDGSARPGDGLPVDIIRPGRRALLVGIGSNQAGNSTAKKAVPSTSPSAMQRRTTVSNSLAQQMRNRGSGHVPILGEGRVVRHFAVEAEPAEPAVGEGVQVHLLAQLRRSERMP